MRRWFEAVDCFDRASSRVACGHQHTKFGGSVQCAKLGDYEFVARVELTRAGPKFVAKTKTRKS